MTDDATRRALPGTIVDATRAGADAAGTIASATRASAGPTDDGSSDAERGGRA